MRHETYIVGPVDQVVLLEVDEVGRNVDLLRVNSERGWFGKGSVEGRVIGVPSDQTRTRHLICLEV